MVGGQIRLKMHEDYQKQQHEERVGLCWFTDASCKTWFGGRYRHSVGVAIDNER